MSTPPKTDPKTVAADYKRSAPGMPPGTPGASKYQVTAPPVTPTPPEVDLGSDEHGPLKPGGRALNGGTGHA